MTLKETFEPRDHGVFQGHPLSLNHRVAKHEDPKSPGRLLLRVLTIPHPERVVRPDVVVFVARVAKPTVREETVMTRRGELVDGALEGRPCHTAGAEKIPGEEYPFDQKKRDADHEHRRGERQEAKEPDPLMGLRHEKRVSGPALRPASPREGRVLRTGRMPRSARRRSTRRPRATTRPPDGRD